MMRPKGTSLIAPAGSPPASGDSGVDDSLSSAAGLGALIAADLAIGTIKIFVDATTQAVQTWQLRSSTATTGAGVQRPDDYAGGTNEKVWFQC